MVVLLRGLPGIHQFMVEGHNAIMNHNKTLSPLELNIRFPQVPVNTNIVTMSGFILENSSVRFIGINVFETRCTGKFCYLQGL